MYKVTRTANECTTTDILSREEFGEIFGKWMYDTLNPEHFIRMTIENKDEKIIIVRMKRKVLDYVPSH